MTDRGYPFVRTILRTCNRGLANSIRTGLEHALGEVLVVMDSDFNHQPHYIPFMVRNLEHFDCVSASRFLYGGGMSDRSRQGMSWIFNIFTRVMTGGEITDSLYGFFAIKREVLGRVDFNRVFWGYGDYCIRLMYFLQKQQASILQFPAINGRRLTGEGNQKFVKIFVQYFSEVCKLAWKERVVKSSHERNSGSQKLPNLRESKAGPHPRLGKPSPDWGVSKDA
jgi:dolichol-phosphate mannosyltransferase